MDPARRLDLFIQRAEELRTSRAVQKGLKNHLEVKWEKTKGLRIEADQPDAEDLRSFLVPFRKFLMSGEPIFLDGMFNLCDLCLTDKELKERVREEREEWKRVRRRPWISLEIDGERLTPERIADLWINGLIFHDNEAKAQAFERMSKEALAVTFLKHQFLDFVIDTTRITLYLAEIVKQAYARGVFDLADEVPKGLE